MPAPDRRRFSRRVRRQDDPGAGEALLAARPLAVGLLSVQRVGWVERAREAHRLASIAVFTAELRLPINVQSLCRAVVDPWHPADLEGRSYFGRVLNRPSKFFEFSVVSRCSKRTRLGHPDSLDPSGPISFPRPVKSGWPISMRTYGATQKMRLVETTYGATQKMRLVLHRRTLESPVASQGC